MIGYQICVELFVFSCHSVIYSLCGQDLQLWAVVHTDVRKWKVLRMERTHSLLSVTTAQGKNLIV